MEPENSGIDPKVQAANEEAEELRREYEDNKLLHYRPCCRKHSKWVVSAEGQEILVNDCPCFLDPLNKTHGGYGFHLCPDSVHSKFHESYKRIRIVFGGNRCIDGNTLIEDPVSRKKIPVKDIKSDFHVWAWDGERLVKAKAKKPFVKGIDDLYELKTSDGNSIVCTKGHRLMTERGWVSVGDLSVGDNLLAPLPYSAFLPMTTSVFFQSTHVSNAKNFLKKVAGFLFGYQNDFRLYDEPLHLATDNGPNIFPSQDDALRYSCSFFLPSYSHLGGQDNKLKYIHSMLEFFLPKSNFGSSQQANLSSNDVSYKPSFSVVTSITYNRNDVYYDFEVPGFHNYFAGGMINHNSSKSTTALCDFLMSICFKKHPYRLTKNPIPGRWRIYAPDFSLLEKVMIPKVKEWIPRASLKFEGKTKEESWEKSFDKRNHILKLKGGSVLDFMSYDQEASKSESDELDGVLADEEMPEEIYDAVQARLITRRGFFIMAVTPLYHLTWAMKFLDDKSSQVEVFRWEIFDNPFNHPTSVKEFEESIKNPQEKEARLYGRFMEFAGLVYKELRPEIHLINRSAIAPDAPVIFALDPHPRKPSVMTWAYLTRKDDIVIFDELEFHGSAKDIVREIGRKERNHAARTVLRLIDPAAKAQGSDIAFETDTLREFEREGMSFSLADNSEAGYNIVHDYLGFDPLKPIGNLNRPRLFFTQDVPLTWYGMTHLMWDDWNRKRAMRDDKERIKDYKKDFPDTVRYIVAGRPSVRSIYMSNPKPIGNWEEARKFHEHQELRQLILGRR